MKILIAEDDPISRRILEKNLLSHGHEVITATNGLQAWEMLKDNEIRMVITDWIMPEMDGLTLCKKIRKKEKETKNTYTYIIILTSKDNLNDIIEGLEAGADDYMTKPVEPQELSVRLKGGKRILNLQEELLEKNMALMELNLKLEEVARTDPLMEIGNRRSFYEVANKFQQQALRHHKSYGLIVCDVDFFKNYNDMYGHLAGDFVLKTVAEIIKNKLRSTDEIFRYGGEEIVLLLPEQDIQGSIYTTEKIRKAIYNRGIEHAGSKYKVLTISCGVAVFDKNAKKWETILEWADMALFEAKAAGRNCTKCKQFPPFFDEKKNDLKKVLI